MKSRNKARAGAVTHISPYRVITLVIIVVIAVVIFLFPLYWIITGAFKTPTAINSPTPVWWPDVWTMRNFKELFSKRSAPLWELHIPLSEWFTKDNSQIVFFSGPVLPAAIRWLINTVFMSVTAMILTCITASLAGYALAKKRSIGRTILFSLIVCAMALPKQVILIPLLREMSALHLTDTLWSVIYPIVGWPFGVFLMKQFAEGIPGEILEAARIDGSGEFQTFITVVFPMIKPSVGALAIFTFINSWNDYFMQLVMLTDTKVLTSALGIAKMQGQFGTDYGLLMAGVALSVPLMREMLKNPRVVGVKNSSMPVKDIQMWKDEGAIVFNGPDEQFVSGLAAGAIGGIGGTYAAMPELYIKAMELFHAGKLVEARQVQNDCCRIIYKMCSTHGNMYATIKEILRRNGGPDVGSVRAPLAPLTEGDGQIVDECVAMIRAAIAAHIG